VQVGERGVAGYFRPKSNASSAIANFSIVDFLSRSPRIAAFTVFLVFLIQNTQNRESSALQLKIDVDSGEPDAIHWVSQRNSALDVWNRATSAYNNAEGRAMLVCEKPLRQALTKINMRFRLTGNDILTDMNPRAFISSLEEIYEDTEKIISEVRLELGIDERNAVPQAALSYCRTAPWQQLRRFLFRRRHRRPA
jgi:hypothetical protein